MSKHPEALGIVEARVEAFQVIVLEPVGVEAQVDGVQVTALGPVGVEAQAGDDKVADQDFNNNEDAEDVIAERDYILGFHPTKLLSWP